MVIESSFEESFPYRVLPFWAGLITSIVQLLRLEYKVNSNPNFIIEKSLLKFVLPVISVAACESYNYCEKIYQYRCIDIHKRVITNHSSIHLVGDQVITSNYTSAKFATD